jgi:Fibronectin type III domain
MGGLVDAVFSTRNFKGVAALACLLGFAAPALGQASALPWSGQATCQLNLQQDGYAHQETQTWTITGTAPRAGSDMPVYDATWSFSGAGSTQRVRGPQTISASWNRSGAPVNTAIAIFIRASDKRLLVKSWHTQLRAAGATTGLQRAVTTGAQASQTAINSDVIEWPFPVIEVAGDSTDVIGTGTTVITGGLLPLQMASANGTATCQWHFARGGVAATTAQAPSTPSTNLAVVNPVLGRPVVSTPRPVATGSGAAPVGSAGGTSAAGGAQGGASQTGSGQGLCAGSPGPGAPQTMATPTVMVGPGLVSLTWAAPPGGGAINSYDVESQPDGSGTPTLQTVQAPATSATIPLGVCIYPAGNCSAASGYTFRVRAHNGAGCGPYSSATTSVRPLVSYVGDNVAGIWAASKCLQCHTGPKVSLDLSGTALESYNRVGLYSARVPGNRDRLLACPTGGSCVTARGGAHPVGFSATSAEYFLLLGWIRDGLRN